MKPKSEIKIKNSEVVDFIKVYNIEKFFVKKKNEMKNYLQSAYFFTY